jgi:Mg2+ and Co2+ transporter CorA
MSLTWHLIRNHEKGTMRSLKDFGVELDQKLQDLEVKTGTKVDDLLKEELGAGPWLATGEAPANYSHPVVRLEAHGELILVVLAVPSSLHNGISDFTNVLMLTHPNAVLTIIRDPKDTYAAEFGGRLLADFLAYQKGEKVFTTGEIVYRATRSCTMSLESSLTTLRASVSHCFKTLRAIEQREQRARNDVDLLEAEFGKTLAELRAMVRTPDQLINVCNGLKDLALNDEEQNHFDEKIARQVTYLETKIAQVESILGTFISDIERAIKRCDDVSKRELLDAQRRNTYWTSALLLPNLIYAFFGQSFLGDARESTQFWWISGVFLVLYGAASSVFLFRLSYRGK